MHRSPGEASIMSHAAKRPGFPYQSRSGQWPSPKILKKMYTNCTQKPLARNCQARSCLGKGHGHKLCLVVRQEPYYCGATIVAANLPLEPGVSEYRVPLYDVKKVEDHNGGSEVQQESFSRVSASCKLSTTRTNVHPDYSFTKGSPCRR